MHREKVAACQHVRKSSVIPRIRAAIAVASVPSHRASGRFALTKSTRYRCPLSFPLLDSFPPIFNNRLSQPGALAVHTSLSTTASVSDRIKRLREIVNRAVGLEEREALANGLGEVCEAYEEGWESGSDDDDDDD